jgi:transposase
MKEAARNYAALIGIDWGDSTHSVQLHDAQAGKVVERRELDASPESVHAWLGELRERYAERGSVAVCLESTCSALLYELEAHDGFLDIYPINPATSERFRKAFKPSGAKDDMPDAGVCLSILLGHRDKIRRWKAADPRDRRLLELSVLRRKAVAQQVDLRNELTAMLKRYFPQALELAGTDLSSPMACEFLRRWPDLASLQRARPETVRRFYHAKGCRRGDVIDKRLAVIAAARPVTQDAVVTETSAQAVVWLARQLLVVASAVADFESRLREACDEHPDAALWRSFPGAGEVLAPRLTAAWGIDRERFELLENMQTYSGIAPVRVRSGKRDIVHRRYHRPLFLHQTFWEYAKQSVLYCRWAADYVRAARARGMRYSTAVRSLAFKWQRIMFACWKSNTPYDEAVHDLRLAAQHSPYAPATDASAAAA